MIPARSLKYRQAGRGLQAEGPHQCATHMGAKNFKGCTCGKTGAFSGMKIDAESGNSSLHVDELTEAMMACNDVGCKSGEIKLSFFRLFAKIMVLIHYFREQEPSLRSALDTA
ncbi:MAG: hypothetical protein ACLU8S_03130 [Coprococcus phoceensis]